MSLYISIIIILFLSVNIITLQNYCKYNTTILHYTKGAILLGMIPIIGTFYAANGKRFFISSTTLTVLKLSSLSFTSRKIPIKLTVLPISFITGPTRILF